MSDIYVFKVYYGSFRLVYIHGTIYAYLRKFFYRGIRSLGGGGLSLNVYISTNQQHAF
jgi:hypothetical protein